MVAIAAGKRHDTSVDGLSAGAADGFVTMSAGYEHSRHRIHRQGDRRPSTDLPQRPALYVGTYALIYVAGHRVDPYSERGLEHVGIQKAIGNWGELVLGPLLIAIGVFMLLGDRLPLPSFGFRGNGESLARRGGWGALLLGVMFALAFCPTSGVFYFGILIPMSATSTAGYLLPVLFAVATALPVLVVAWILAFGARRIGLVYGRMQTVQKWLNRIVGGLFTVLGIYYCVIMYF